MKQKIIQNFLTSRIDSAPNTPGKVIRVESNLKWIGQPAFCDPIIWSKKKPINHPI